MNFPAHIARLRGNGIIMAAAKHNLREIAAEIGVDRRIDPTRIKDNYILRGPVDAKSVSKLAKSLLAAAGTPRLRKDAVHGLEVLFTWPFPDRPCPGQYFEDCTRWAEDHFQVPILSSVVHLDESHPHCHVLMLPLINGRMNGSNLFGNSTKLSKHLNSFYMVVGAVYGIARPISKPRLSATTRDFVIAQAQSILSAVLGERTASILLEPHRKDPNALLEHFNIQVRDREPEKSPSFIEIFTRKVKPERAAPPPYGPRLNVGTMQLRELTTLS